MATNQKNAKRSIFKLKDKYQYWGILFISPWIIGFLVLQLYPLLSSLRLSFTNYKLLSEYKYIGLDNYIYMFTGDYNFLNSLIVTLISVLIRVPLRLLVALLIALLLNRKLKGVGIYRTALYLPSIFGGSVAISVVWRFLFMREGVVNQFTSLFGIPPVDWLGNTTTALFIVSLVGVWQFGASMVIFLAGLKQVPNELYEAAKIDGANSIQRFFRITFPQISPVMLFNLLMQSINALQEFTTPFVITKGGPAKSTYLFSMLIYDNGFKYTKMGYASALSWFMFLIILVMTVLIFESSKRWVHYNE
ncbi:MAG: carbohydrate ABC transporter permease [Saccharofermentanales bacterium]|jgi:oligogalacturonide transport system permease protein